MPTVVFKPVDRCITVDPSTKLLVAATRGKVPIRFGCASCRCGTCAVAVTLEPGSEVSPMRPDEEALLARMMLPTDGTVRLACQTRIIAGTVTVDLDFQDTYSPDQGNED